jgi:hypothetical protein
MPLLFPSRQEPSNPLAGLGFFHLALPVIQHFVLLPTAIGFGLGVLLGHPAVGLVIGLATGLLYGGFMAILLRRALREGFQAPPPPGGWRTWDDDDDWDT